MALFPGKMVIYRWRSGQVRAGQTESAALVTRVNADGTVNLKVFPDDPNGDLWFKAVPPASDKIQSHCWLLTPDDNDRKAPEKPVLRLQPRA